MSHPRIVVTGTDTDVGKTVFAAALTGALGAHYWKPVQAGVDPYGDRERVAGLAGVPAALAALAPVPAALAPLPAALAPLPAAVAAMAAALAPLPAAVAAMAARLAALVAGQENRTLERANARDLDNVPAGPLPMRLLQRPAIHAAGAAAIPVPVGGFAAVALDPGFLADVAGIGGIQAAAPVGAVPGAGWPAGAAWAWPAVTTQGNLTVAQLAVFSAFYGHDFGCAAADPAATKIIKFRAWLAGR